MPSAWLAKSKLELRVSRLGFRVQGSGFRVSGGVGFNGLDF